CGTERRHDRGHDLRLNISKFDGIAAWNYGVEHIGANRSGPFLHLIPLYTALFSGIFLNEDILAFHVFVLLSILIGVWIAARGHPPSKSTWQSSISNA